MRALHDDVMAVIGWTDPGNPSTWRALGCPEIQKLGFGRMGPGRRLHVLEHLGIIGLISFNNGRSQDLADKVHVRLRWPRRLHPWPDTLRLQKMQVRYGTATYPGTSVSALHYWLRLHDEPPSQREIKPICPAMTTVRHLFLPHYSAAHSNDSACGSYTYPAGD
jgi:hypothetical protein